MRTRRGFTLIELLTGLVLMFLTLSGVVSLTIGSLRSFTRTSQGIDLSEGNARAMRRVTETLRQAMTVTVLDNGARIQYQMPLYSATNDPVTGEKELLEPLTWDNVVREFRVTGGSLVDGSGKKLVRNVVLTDPDPASSGYNLSYAPFALGTVGATRSVTVTLMTRATTVSGTPMFWRLKNSVLLRNAQ